MGPTWNRSAIQYGLFRRSTLPTWAISTSIRRGTSSRYRHAYPLDCPASLEISDIEGTVNEYDFEKSETPDGVVFSITSPELATAVKMGDAVKTTLVITTKDGEVSGDYKHHSH